MIRSGVTDRCQAGGRDHRHSCARQKVLPNAFWISNFGIAVDAAVRPRPERECADIGPPARRAKLTKLSAAYAIASTTFRPSHLFHIRQAEHDENLALRLCSCGRSHPPQVRVGFIVTNILHERAANKYGCCQNPGKSRARSEGLGQSSRTSRPTRTRTCPSCTS